MRQAGFRRRGQRVAAAVLIKRRIPERFASSNHPLIVAMRRWQSVLITFAASRLMIGILMVLSTMIVVPGQSGPRGGFSGILTQGVGAQYVEIATAGYGSGEAGLGKIGLFPLYPMAVRVIAVILRDPAISAIVVSNLALLVAGILLKELLDLHYRDPRISRAAVTFLMFSPVSFLYSGAHVEATLLMLTLAAWYAASTRRWLVASVVASCASASHPFGLLILLPAVGEYLKVARAERVALRDGFLLLAGAPLGLGAFLLFSWLRIGDALAPLRAFELWNRGLVSPWTAVAATQLIPPFYRAFTLLMLGAAAAIWCAGLLLKVRRSYLLYSGLLLVLYACSPALPSIARWLSIAFPLFVILAVITRRFEWSLEPLLACSFTLLAFCTVMIANGHWMP